MKCPTCADLDDVAAVACDTCRGSRELDLWGRVRAKSSAIVLGHAAKRSGDSEKARRHFRIAAEIESVIVDERVAAGRGSDCAINASSEARCWLEAGETQRAHVAAVRGLELVRVHGAPTPYVTEDLREVLGASGLSRLV